MRIHFKNVHNGDSIIIEWFINSERHVGIIDCSIDKFGNNPVVDYLKKHAIKKIDFAVCSHPHLDHFLGYFELFGYCEEEKAKINEFYHTAAFGIDQVTEIISESKFTGKEIFKRLLFSNTDNDNSRKKAIAVFYHVLRHQEKTKDFILQVIPITNHSLKLALCANSNLFFCSPTLDQIIPYVYLNLKTDGDTIVANNANNPYGNTLATLIVLDYFDYRLLFTSDIEKDVLKKNLSSISKHSRKILLSQIPHHGSAKNFDSESWQHIVNSNQNVQYVISAGEKYSHPAYDVVKWFQGCSKSSKVACTNFVNGYKEYFNEKRGDGLDLTDELGLISKEIIEKNNGSLTFDISKKGELTLVADIN